MRELAKRLLQTIRKQGLIEAGDRVAVAVSGGADSVALLLLLLEMRAEVGVVLSVAHVNHQLRGRESDDDETFVAELASKYGLELHTRKVPLAQLESGIEAAARKLRYDFFRQLAEEGRISKIATAHTLDDQAETVLLRMLRGTGIRGLAGIHPRIEFEGRGEVVRPLLAFRRAELEAYLRECNQAWREDSSNRDPAFLRNRVRHRVLPLLKEEFGAGAVENLANLAEIARAEEEHWAFGHPEIDKYDASSPENLRGFWIVTAPLASQRRLIRNWLEANVGDLAVSFRMIEELRDLAFGDVGRKVELPGGYLVRGTQRGLCFERVRDQAAPSNYEYRLPIPGAIEMPELGIRLEAVLVDPNTVPQAEHESLLDPARLPPELIIRNWRPGDRYWPAHTKDEKKVKRLLADRHLTGPPKKLWPVAAAPSHGLVWMRGFPAPAAFHPQDLERPALWIRIADHK